MSDRILSIRDLSVEFTTEDGVVQAVEGVSYDVDAGEVLGVVGESGSGKSVTAMTVLGLIPQPPGRVTSGEVLYRGRDLLKLSNKELGDVRGSDVAMIFQDPMTSLNPVLTVGEQIGEAIETHHPEMRGDAIEARTIELLDIVGVPFPEARFRQYPHEFSGGMRQRAMIAMAIANEPSVLIADEPTTALDVTIQAQIIEVLKKAEEETHAAVILITHDLGLIAELADRVVVMYAGRVVETGDVETIFTAPRNPYTIGLMNSVPRVTGADDLLIPIPGSPPSMISVPPGCAFHPRCFLSGGRDRCRTEVPELKEVAAGHLSRCHFVSELAGYDPRHAAAASNA